MELRTGICPQCGEKLEIPFHLDAFSCIYCGARLSPADLEKTVACEDDGSAAAFYRDNILSVLTEYRQIDKSLNKNAYAPAMDAYETDCREVFEQLDIALRAGSLTAESAVDHLLDALAENWSSQRNSKSLMEGDKFRMAIFTVPMIRRLGLATMDDFCQTLHQRWMERYPKHPWAIGDFEVINSSFRKKILGLCFITTAVCLEEGKADDCAELTAFRGFRDGYLQTCPDGPSLVDEYYRIAPWIVLEIEKKADAKNRYAAIRQDYLSPCYEALQAGQFEQCKSRYTKMVRELEKEYLN